MEITKAHQDIYDAVQASEGGNLMIRAVAGAGKTTTIVKCLDLIPVTRKVLFLAFNRKIAMELQTRVPKHVKAQTLNSLGHGAYMGWMRVNGMDPKTLEVDSGKVADHARELCRFRDVGHAIGAVTRMVRLAKSAGMAPMSTEPCRALVRDTDDAWVRLMEHHDVDLPARNEVEMPVGDFLGLCRTVLLRSWETRQVIDYDDQLWLSVLLGARVPSYDWVFCDESQDLSPLQHELMARALGPAGRVVAVGDDRQAIYGFRGAAADSMDVLKARFNMRDLPLHVSYRCPQQVVAAAQEYVPHIQPHASAPQGEVVDEDRLLWDADVRVGDMVLCRFTAPLVEARLAYLKRGIPAQILGTDMARSLLGLIETLEPRGLKDLANRLDKWEVKERLKAGENEARAAAVSDRADSLRTFIEAARELPHLETLIREAFTEDPGARITLASIHRSKGLENRRVFIINHGDIPKFARQEWQIKQEKNLLYVAVTRAQERLEYVRVPRPKRKWEV